jgi:hypothetical protein
MVKEEQSMNVYEKLTEARVMLQKMNIRKSGKNKFAGFSYYELSDFIPAVNELFKELKLTSIFSIKEGEAILKIINAAKPEESIEFTSPIVSVELKGCTAIQGIGAEQTYMMRYLYQNALNIVESDVLDATAGTATGNTSYGSTAIDLGSVNTIEDLNKAFDVLHRSKKSKDTSWKRELMNKAHQLGARFDESVRRFVDLTYVDSTTEVMANQVIA